MRKSRTLVVLTAGLLSLAVALPGCGALGGLGGLGGGSPIDLIASLLGSPVGGPWGVAIGLFVQVLTHPLPEPFSTEFSGEPWPQAFLKVVLPAPVNPPLTATLLASVSEAPLQGAIAPDGMLYYGEKNTGKVRRFDPNSASPTIQDVLDLPVNNTGERGLVGIAFTPTGVDPARMFLTYVRSSTDSDTTDISEAMESRVSSFPFPSPTVDGETVLFHYPASDPNFPLPAAVNGMGPCRVGPDQKLYFSHGDWNTRLGGQIPLDINPAGKIHRVEFDGSIPTDNPMTGQTTFCLGLRSSIAFNWDSMDNSMTLDDRGLLVGEELNTGAAGGNYGFPLVVGSAGTDWENLVTLLPLYRQPFLDFGNAKPLPDMTSLVIIRGGAYGPDLEGHIFYNQHNTSGSGIIPLGAQASRIVHLAFAPLNPIVPWGDVWVAPDTAGRITCMVPRADGLLVVLCEHEIYLLNAPPPAP
ncbi:MAG: PQQ-dependent sugar dehydrogenase [Phycisphaerae bacterium]